MSEKELRAVRRASRVELARAMAEAARLVGDVEPTRAPGVWDAGFASGLLAAVRSPLARACLMTALGG